MNYKFYNKTLSFLTGGVIVFNLCGCSNKKNSSKVDIVVPTKVSTFVTSVTDVTSSVTTKITTSTTNVSTSTTTTSTTNLVTESVTTSEMSIIYKDGVVLNQFSDMGVDIRNSIDTSDFLDKGKMYFIYCVDFLFFDGEIKGVKYSDLSEMAKKQLISDIITIDDLICSKFPNYKESISETGSSAYSKASDIIHSGSTSVNDYSREKLGEDNYNKIGEYKDLFIEQTSQDWEEFTGIVGDGYEKGKSKVKEWYENFKAGQ